MVIAALASFAALVIAWIVAPDRARTTEEPEATPEATPETAPVAA